MDKQSLRLELVPISQKEAKLFVKRHHRHHKPPVGSIFQVACSNGNKIVGVAIVGRPVARLLDNGWTVEITRLCTIGTKNAASMLCAAAWRIAKNLGYKKLITYILDNETGTSLTAAGFKNIGECGGGKWNRKGRPRVDEHPLQRKIKFEKSENDGPERTV